MAVNHTRDVLSGYTDLVFSKVHPLVDECSFLCGGAQQVHFGPDGAHWIS